MDGATFLALLLSTLFSHPDGPYTLYIAQDFPTLEWAHVERAFVEGGTLRVLYPEGQYGSSASGASFLVALPPGQWKECYLSYSLLLEEGFDFSRGGKLPGLTQGGTVATACREPRKDAWSARPMWREDGYLYLYLYWMGRESECGTYFPALGQSTYQLPVGQWVTLLLHVDAQRGNVELFAYDGEWHRVADATVELSAEPAVSHFYFNTFFGGSDASWAPSRDSYARFDNIIVACS